MSVIIPVYNAVEFLDECLRSVAAQSIGFDRVEVVTVDDGSTDGSGALLDRWAASHPNVRVVHQPNSGAPGGPRNRAVELATGEFLFFADPDDYLGAEALERMVAAARRNESDVVLGRIRGIGRTPATAPFAQNVEGGDVLSTKAVWSLTAHKLFRTSLVREHRLRFAEGVRLAEEQPFVVRAYFLARSISVVADYDCYHLVHRDGYPHLTRQVPDPEPFYANVRDVLATVHAHTQPGSVRNSLLRRWIQIELLGKFRQRFTGLPGQLQQRYVEQARGVLEDFVPTDALATLPVIDQIRDRLIREGATGKLVTLAKFEAGTERQVAELTAGPGRRQVSIVLRPETLLPDDRKDIHIGLAGHRRGGGVESPVSMELIEDRDCPATLRAPLDLRALVRSEPVPAHVKFSLQLRTSDHMQQMPLPVSVANGGAGFRRMWIVRGRPMTTWVDAGRDGGVRINVGGTPEVATAIRRRIRRHVRAVKRRLLRRTAPAASGPR